MVLPLLLARCYLHPAYPILLCLASPGLMVQSCLPALPVLRPVTPIQVIHEARPAPRRLQPASQPAQTRPVYSANDQQTTRASSQPSPARQSRPCSTRLLYSSSRLLTRPPASRSSSPPISSHRIPSRLVSFGAGRSVSRSVPSPPTGTAAPPTAAAALSAFCQFTHILAPIVRHSPPQLLRVRVPSVSASQKCVRLRMRLRSPSCVASVVPLSLTD